MFFVCLPERMTVVLRQGRQEIWKDMEERLDVSICFKRKSCKITKEHQPSSAIVNVFYMLGLLSGRFFPSTTTSGDTKP